MVTCDSDYIWRTWSCYDSTSTGYCYNTSATDYATTNVTNVVWSNWVATGDSNSGNYYNGTANQPTWNQWVTVYYTTENLEAVVDEHPAISEEEARIRREREAQEAEYRRLREIDVQKSIELANKKREEAEQIAKDLLLDLIGEEELKVYEETGRVFVKGREFDYIIQKTGYLQKITKTKVVDLCIHLQNRTKYPQTDNVIALLLGIQNEESKILKLANNHGSRDLPQELPKCAKVA